MSRKRFPVSIILVLAAAVTLSGQSPRRFLVGFRPGTPDSQADSAIAGAQGRTVSKIPQIRVHVIELPANADENAIVNSLKNRREVSYVEPDRLVPVSAVTPNDPWYTNWEWHLQKISAPTAWSTTTGSGNVVIAIVDTGVESTHQDLSIKLVPGWNIYNNNSDTSDVYGHGTLVAGAAAAITDNAMGVAAVCWQCMIMPVRVSDTSGNATYSNLAAGVTWAADHGAKVANMSYQVSASSTVTSAAQYFMSKGGVVTSAAGNAGSFVTASPNAYMLTVGGTDPNDARYSWSNYGNNLDLVAPGCVFTTATGSAYNSACGTSLSAPLVAGVAGLMFAANPSLSASQAVSYLKQSADDLGSPGWDTTFGWGRLNASRAVAMATNSSGSGDTTPPTVTLTAPANGIAVSGVVSMQASASDNVGVTSVSFAIDGAAVCTVAAAPYHCSWNTASSSNGSHLVTATARDAAGNSASSSATVTVSNSVDVTPPSIAITSPANGAKVSRTVSVTTSSSDNVGVVSVDLHVDGVKIATSTTAPFSFSWNTRGLATGTHTLQAVAHDAAGNTGSSPLVIVTK